MRSCPAARVTLHLDTLEHPRQGRPGDLEVPNGTATKRDGLHHQLITAVEHRSVLLSTPPPASTPAAFRRPDGTSQFTPEFGAVYTSQAILDAEAHLLDAGRTLARESTAWPNGSSPRPPRTGAR
jgi:hypothetical protein